VNVGSLFTGVGGFDLGLERAGHTIAFQCEADAKCREVLRRHWPEVPIYEDVVTCNPTEPTDLLCGGFPCQDLSVAGKRAGLAGERSGLFFEAARIADAFLGDGGWLLIENVPGLLSSQGGRDFGIVLSTLRELGFLDGAWRVLDSRYFGVPQRRRRVFVLARRARGRRAAEVLLEPESGGGDFEASRAKGKGAARTFGVGVAGTLGASGHTGRSRPDDLDGHGAFVAPAVTSKWRKGSGGPAGDECQNLVSGPLTRRYGKGINTTLDDGAIICSSPDPDRVREAARVPRRVDGDLMCAIDPKPDGPRYAQMGNAVTVQVAEWIGHRLTKFGGDE